MNLDIGQKATVETTVTEDKTAKYVGSGSLEVFATPMLIAQMERAACACLEEALDAGNTSVGTAVNVEHTAASPCGMTIITTAEVTAIDGRKIDFLVVAHDEYGEIGRGTHTRFVVDSDRFMKKVTEKK